jgi:hypothetical protein
MTNDITNKAVTDNEAQERMKELKAEVRALAEWKKKIEEQTLQGAARSAPIGSPLQSPLGPTARLAIDRATRPPDRNQLDLIGPIAGRVK